MGSKTPDPRQAAPDTQHPTPNAKQWNPDLYDGKHSFVWKYGEGLLELLAPQSGERILDLGSGTGHLTNKIAASGAEVIGIDVDPAMLEQARRNYPNLRFEYADGVSFRFEQPFDAVFSNAAIHWMKDPPAVVGSVYEALKPGGRFVAEFGHKGNLKRIHDALYRAVAHNDAQPSRSFKYYPSVGEYASLLEQAGFLVSYGAYFDRPTPLEGGESGLRNWVHNFADDYLRGASSEKHDAIIKEVEDELRAELFREGTWFADYKRIRVVAIR